MNKKPSLIKRKLDAMQQRFGMGKMIQDMVISALPQFAEQLAKMEKPSDEGGLLKEGETKLAYLITQTDGELNISLCPLAFDQELQKMILKKPISNQPLAELLQQQTEDDHGDE